MSLHLYMNLSDADKGLFNKIYDELLKERGNCNILLQTYFGDVRDIYEDIINKHLQVLDLILMREERHLN